MEVDAKNKGFKSIVKDKEEFVRQLMGAGVFEKMPSGENHYKCTTCNIKLAGKPGSNKILSQLFGHFVHEKHTGKLRVQVKAEVTGEEAPARQEQEREPVAAAPIAPARPMKP